MSETDATSETTYRVDIERAEQSIVVAVGDGAPPVWLRDIEPTSELENWFTTELSRRLVVTRLRYWADKIEALDAPPNVNKIWDTGTRVIPNFGRSDG